MKDTTHNPGGQVSSASKPHSVLQVDINEKSFPASEPIFESLSFSIAAGEFVTILGRSGCGKTTLLRMICGLDLDFEGSIMLGKDTVEGPGTDRGMIFQESRLLPWKTVKKNIEFALPALPQEEIQTKVAKALSIVGLTEEADKLPYQLSGGMEKRVALARALVNIPSILLMDEPLCALDVATKYDLQNEIVRMHRSETFTSLFVTHDVEEAVFLSDRILVLGQKPCKIIADLSIDIDGQTRDRFSPGFTKYCRELQQIMLQN